MGPTDARGTSQVHHFEKKPGVFHVERPEGLGMPWLEAHDNLGRHPKTAALCSAMGWPKDLAVGRLLHLWWWVLDFAPDGDLRRFNDAQIAVAMCVDVADAAKLKEALIAACWLDRKPYFRVHDWWDYAGRFLQIRWKHKPERWKAVRDAYAKNHPENPPENGSKNIKPHQPNQTDQPTPTHTNQPDAGAGEGELAERKPVSVTMLRRPKDLAECLTRASMLGLPESDARQWYADCEACDWKRGDGTPFDNWPRQMCIHRDKLRERAAMTGAKPDGTPAPSGAQLIVWQKEFERVVARMEKIRASYSENLSWSEDDKAAYRKLKARKMDLMKWLGMQV